MKFDWTDIPKELFDITKKSCGNPNYADHEWIGFIRVGNLCFDIFYDCYADSGENVINLEYEAFVGGIDSGYGYSDREGKKNYPYDYVGNANCSGGGIFDDGWYNMSYEEFKAHAEQILTDFIAMANKYYDKADLIAEANKELNLW